MSLPWGIGVLIAIGITFFAMELATAAIAAMRRRSFRHFEKSSEDAIHHEFPIPKLDGSQVAEHSDVLSSLVRECHNEAVEAQTVYHKAVIRSVACLVVAFLALVLGMLPRQSWDGLTVDYETSEHVLCWLDAITILFVLALFVHARAASARWLKARATSELLRQYHFLGLIFPDSIVNVSEVKSQFKREADAVRNRIDDGGVSDLILRIEDFWSKRKKLIENRILTDRDVSSDALLFYLRKRPLRQLGWFADSQARLEHIAEQRNAILMSLYCVSALLAVVKLVLLLHSSHTPAYLLPLLLVTTGMSAAMTAYYINQNARSLIHRYNTQRRRIAMWLKALDNRWNLISLASRNFDAREKAEIRARLLEFEDLMVEELADSIHITSSDAIELAP